MRKSRVLDKSWFFFNSVCPLRNVIEIFCLCVASTHVEFGHLELLQMFAKKVIYIIIVCLTKIKIIIRFWRSLKCNYIHNISTNIRVIFKWLFIDRSNINFYDRVKGLFRICFPYDEKPRKNWRDFFLVRFFDFLIWKDLSGNLMKDSIKREKKSNSVTTKCNFI
jgi:hypothetical protein